MFESCSFKNNTSLFAFYRLQLLNLVRRQSSGKQVIGPCMIVNSGQTTMWKVGITIGTATSKTTLCSSTDWSIVSWRSRRVSISLWLMWLESRRQPPTYIELNKRYYFYRIHHDWPPPTELQSIPWSIDDLATYRYVNILINFFGELTLHFIYMFIKYYLLI